MYASACSTHSPTNLPLAKRGGSEGGGGMAEGSLSLEGGGRLGRFILISPSLIGAAPLPLTTPPPLPPSFLAGGGPLPLTLPTGSLEELTTGGGPSENFLEGGAGASWTVGCPFLELFSWLVPLLVELLLLPAFEILRCWGQTQHKHTRQERQLTQWST